MKEIIGFILFIGACIIIIGIANNDVDDRCIEKGGQIIRNSTKMNHGCIMPAGKR
jgi:hypothetical protein